VQLGRRRSNCHILLSLYVEFIVITRFGVIVVDVGFCVKRGLKWAYHSSPFFAGIKLFDDDTADFKVERDVAMADIVLAFYIWGAHFRHLGSRTEPSICGGDAALCQITLTTCSPIPIR